MKKIFRKAWLLLAVMLLLLSAAPFTALADGGEDELVQTVDGYRITLVFESPFVIGENKIHLQVSDAQGQPVSHAHVEVGVVEAEVEHTEAVESTPQSDIHGMKSMPEPELTPIPDEHSEIDMQTFAAGHEAGEYAGEIGIADSGEWIIQVHLTVDEHLVEFEFPLHVANFQAGKNILLGFFAINAVILGTAATLKLKPAATSHFRG